MLLTVQLVPHPEVPAHLQVQPAVCAGVTAGVAVAPLLDADSVVPAGGDGEGRAVSLGTWVEVGPQAGPLPFSFVGSLAPRQDSGNIPKFQTLTPRAFL